MVLLSDGWSVRLIKSILIFMNLFMNVYICEIVWTWLLWLFMFIVLLFIQELVCQSQSAASLKYTSLWFNIYICFFLFFSSSFFPKCKISRDPEKLYLAATHFLGTPKHIVEKIATTTLVSFFSFLFFLFLFFSFFFKKKQNENS